jgi:methionyl-tRNA formyltransferase
MPDKPLGRGHEIQKNIIKQTAEHIGIKNMFDWFTLREKKTRPVSSTSSSNFLTKSQVVASLQELQADYFVVVAYGKILPLDILDIPTL